MDGAPFHQNLAEGPETGRAAWCVTDDGIRVRVGWWGVDDARGTIFLFPGRTEYIEKYGRVATEATAAGFAVIGIDWRGQGLSDRIAKDPRVGHVGTFTDYQRDLAAMVAVALDVGLPKPWHLLAHSMGGCIGLRALIDGLDVTSAVFSSPMWGIEMAPFFRPLTHVLPPLARLVGAGEAFAPTTRPTSYIADTPFEENALTSDQVTYDWFRAQTAFLDEFALGGPSVRWIGAATTEMAALSRLPRPTVQSRTYVGTKEEIVSTKAIRAMHANWPNGDLHVIEGAKHELMMERAALRSRFLNETFAFFEDPK